MLRSLLTPRVLLTGLIMGILLFMAVLLLLWFTRPESRAYSPAALILNVTPAPTVTQSPPTPSPISTATGAPVTTNTLVSGGFAQVSGTGGDGLRLRLAPGLNGEIKLLGSEGEIYQIVEGPQEADGYTWWLLVDPDDDTRRGWAVGDFLQPSQSP